jgi:hypothetical protein
MRYRAALPRLPLAIVKRATKAVIAFVANLGAAVPKLLRVGLVGNIVQHAYYFAFFDLVKQLTAKLEVVALLIDREGPVTDDVNPFSTF